MNCMIYWTIIQLKISSDISVNKLLGAGKILQKIAEPSKSEQLHRGGVKQEVPPKTPESPRAKTRKPTEPVGKKEEPIKSEKLHAEGGTKQKVPAKPLETDRKREHDPAKETAEKDYAPKEEIPTTPSKSGGASTCQSFTGTMGYREEPSKISEEGAKQKTPVKPSQSGRTKQNEPTTETIEKDDETKEKQPTKPLKIDRAEKSKPVTEPSAKKEGTII
ncbi:uncharacterized protein LOC143203155 [Rhynchophorus ferrugineus]|uniref:uncharacterized protein LOC143203155 n=1 Tax=Rhynchophorus ferrugineus TaxID=354439 RepID=UPI003FCC3DFA